MDQGSSEPRGEQSPQSPPPPPYHPPQPWYAPYNWGAPPALQAPPASQPPPASSATLRRQSIGRGLMKAGIGVGIAAGVAIGATVIASAASSPAGTQSTSNLAGDSTPTTQGTSPSSGTSNSTSTPPLPGSGFGGPGRGLGMMGDSVIHGQFTIEGPSGYETMDERTGTVSSITNTSGSTWSLEVKSSDGTSATFTVDSGTSVNGGEMGISSVKQGDTVTVVALDNNGSTTAKEVRDRTVLQNSGSSWMPQHSHSSSGSSSQG